MATLDREEFYQVINAFREDMRAGFDGVHDRMDTLNGRTRTVETKVAVLEAAPPGRDQAARVTGAGAVLTSLFTVIWQWLMK